MRRRDPQHPSPRERTKTPTRGDTRTTRGPTSRPEISGAQRKYLRYVVYILSALIMWVFHVKLANFMKATRLASDYLFWYFPRPEPKESRTSLSKEDGPLDPGDLRSAEDPRAAGTATKSKVSDYYGRGTSTAPDEQESRTDADPSYPAFQQEGYAALAEDDTSQFDEDAAGGAPSPSSRQEAQPRPKTFALPSTAQNGRWNPTPHVNAGQNATLLKIGRDKLDQNRGHWLVLVGEVYDVSTKSSKYYRKGRSYFGLAAGVDATRSFCIGDFKRVAEVRGEKESSSVAPDDSGAGAGDFKQDHLASLEDEDDACHVAVDDWRGTFRSRYGEPIGVLAPGFYYTADGVPRESVVGMYQKRVARARGRLMLRQTVLQKGFVGCDSSQDTKSISFFCAKAELRPMRINSFFAVDPALAGGIRVAAPGGGASSGMGASSGRVNGGGAEMSSSTTEDDISVLVGDEVRRVEIQEGRCGCVAEALYSALIPLSQDGVEKKLLLRFVGRKESLFADDKNEEWAAKNLVVERDVSVIASRERFFLEIEIYKSCDIGARKCTMPINPQR